MLSQSVNRASCLFVLCIEAVSLRLLKHVDLMIQTKAVKNYNS